MRNESALYSQHIKGSHNVIADSLSRDHHLSNEKLTFAYHTLLPTQAPRNFSISPLPKEIDCWVRSLSLMSTSTQAVPQHPIRSKLGALIGGDDSLETMGSKMNGCLSIKANSAHLFCQHSRALAAEISMVLHENIVLKGVQLNPPLRMYGRPSGKIYGQTQG